MTVYRWSQTADSNGAADTTISFREGMGASQYNNSARALMAAVARWRDDMSGRLVTGGTSTAYTVTTNQGVSGSLPDGLSLRVQIHTTNGASPTINIDSMGAKPLRAVTGQALGTGHLIAGTTYDVTYRLSSDEFIVVNSASDAFVIPIGAIIDYAATSLPSSNFAYPAGQQVSRTTYASLFSLIGTTFGAGNGTTTFNLPDLRGRTVFAEDDMGGTAAGRITSALSGVAGATFGTTGGGQTATIGKTNLPNYNLPHTFAITSAGNHNHDITILRGIVSGGSGSATALMAPSSSYDTGSVTETTDTGGAHVHGLTGAAQLDGDSTPLPVMPPLIILNKIMRVL